MKISFSPPDMTELEVEEVKEAILSGWITTGPKTKEFERQIAEYCHVNRAVYTNSKNLKILYLCSKVLPTRVLVKLILKRYSILDGKLLLCVYKLYV